LEDNKKPESRDIHDLLIYPVQRLPAIMKTLQQLKSSTPGNHSDYLNVEATFNSLDKIFNPLTETIATCKNMHKILSIQYSGSNSISLLKPSRVFVREGEVSLLSSKQKNGCQIFLFNDIFLMARKSVFKGNFQPFDRMDVEKMQINISDARGTSLDIKGENGAHTLIFKSSEERDSWFKQIQDEIQKKKGGDSQPKKRPLLTRESSRSLRRSF